MKRYLMWALVLVVVMWVIRDPASAAHVAHELSGALNHAARSLSSLASAS